ncbi:cupin domain-containing protein [Flexithrix dorotheae]|uniref:cupin domain-containing protein n=1 Tax=Flexithrix dorotheae TaxID=70993 RepID=UPI00037D323F|nr:cupin domain-containing protein [Flexithrix dorotheae]
MKEKEIIRRVLSDLVPLVTSHGKGEKRILINNEECKSGVAQVAFGKLKPGEIVESHQHPDMEEFFFFLEGRGIYEIGGKEYEVSPETFIRIPIKTNHELSVKGDGNLRFIYWGVVLD